MGNICRSPTAEGAFRLQLEKHNVVHLFEVDSAGTHAYHIGEAPDPRAQSAAKKQGVDLSSQRARQVCQSDFDYYDYIFAMDGNNLATLQASCPSKHQHKLALMLDNLPNNSEKHVPDPYFDGSFDAVFHSLSAAATALLQKLIITQQTR